MLSDYTFAVRATDEPGATLLTIGKAYTGLTDAEIATMTEHFHRITLRDHGRYRTVHPEVVVEIAFDRIMRSTRHRSGFAMRFPRIVRIRDDKTPADIDTLATVEALFGEQASGRILLATGARGETERIAATGGVDEGGRGGGGAARRRVRYHRRPMSELELPEHVAANRAYWDEQAPDYVANGEASWATDEPRWGIWGIPEADVHLLPPTWMAGTSSSSDAAPPTSRPGWRGAARGRSGSTTRRRSS